MRFSFYDPIIGLNANQVDLVFQVHQTLIGVVIVIYKTHSQTVEEAYPQFLAQFIETTEKMVYELGTIRSALPQRQLPPKQKELLYLVQKSIKTYQSLFRDIRQESLFSAAYDQNSPNVLDLVKDTTFLMKGTLLTNLVAGSHLLLQEYPDADDLRKINVTAKKLQFILHLMLSLFDIEENVHHGDTTAVPLLPILQSPPAYDRPYTLQISGDGVLVPINAKKAELETIFALIYWSLAGHQPANRIWIDSTFDQAEVEVTIWNTVVTFKPEITQRYQALIDSPSLFFASKISGVTLPLAIALKFARRNKGRLEILQNSPTQIRLAFPTAL